MFLPSTLDPADWSDSAHARRMLEFVYPPHSEGTGPDMPRKLRLYLTALGRVHWHRLSWAARVFVTLGERMAEGWRLNEGLYEPLYNAADRYTHAADNPDERRQWEGWLRQHGYGTDVPAVAVGYQLELVRMAFVPLWRMWRIDDWVAPRLHRTDLIRDIFPPPGQPPFDSEWRTGTTTQLAEEMYAAGVFDRMPILADALQDAGCENAHILTHCRDAEQRHVRGCWVVDQLLEKPA